METIKGTLRFFEYKHLPGELGSVSGLCHQFIHTTLDRWFEWAESNRWCYGDHWDVWNVFESNQARVECHVCIAREKYLLPAIRLFLEAKDCFVRSMIPGQQFVDTSIAMNTELLRGLHKLRSAKTAFMLAMPIDSNFHQENPDPPGKMWDNALSDRCTDFVELLWAKTCPYNLTDPSKPWKQCFAAVAEIVILAPTGMSLDDFAEYA